jgi:hypothetical protein
MTQPGQWWTCPWCQWQLHNSYQVEGLGQRLASQAGAVKLKPDPAELTHSFHPPEDTLTLSLRSTSRVVEEIIAAWLAPVAEEERDEEDRRGIQMLAEIENEAITGYK